MNFLVFGAGAIGTYIGGSLGLHGHRAVFLERPAGAEQLRSRGLRLMIGGETFHLVSPEVEDSLTGALARHPFDLILFALKAFDTESVAQTLGQVQSRLPPVLCLQNGVDNEPMLRAALGQDRVIAGTVTSSISRRGVGDIVLERLRGVGVAATHERSSAIAAAMAEAGLNPRLYPNSDAMKWSKLLTNLLTNASAAILDITPAEVLAHPGLFRLEMLQLREALKVMAASGIPVVDLPGTPVRALSLAARALPFSIGRLVMARAVGKGRGDKMPSLHIDLHSGRSQSEAAYLNGGVVRHAAPLEIAVPVNSKLAEIVLALARGELPLDTYARNPQALIEDVIQ